MKTISRLIAGVFTLAGCFESAKACDLSGFTLNNVSSLGNNRYKIDVTFCAGSGISSGRYGADQGTTLFAFYMSMNAKVDTFSHDTIRSPLTGDAFKAYKLTDDSYLSVPYKASTLFYIGPNETEVWTCINNGCGSVRSICRSLSIYTIGLPDTIWLRGMEAGGNILGGCTNLKVYPKCYGVSPLVSAGSNQTVYLSSSFNCATLTSTVSGGAGGYDYKWSTGESTTSITVCPTSNKTYTLKVTDANFCTTTASVTVSVSCNKSSLTCNAGADQTIYKGYGATCVTLNGSANAGAGSYSYKWSHGPVTAQVSVCPTVTTTYSLVVTDAYGCKDTDYVTVNVKDIRCGKNLSNVELCYQNKTRCVSQSNVSYYTQRGATLGACGSAPFMGEFEKSPSVHLLLFPNPTTEKVNVVLAGSADYTVTLTDISGREIQRHIIKGNADRSEIMSELNLNGVSPGMYVVNVVTLENKQMVKQLIVH